MNKRILIPLLFFQLIIISPLMATSMPEDRQQVVLQQFDLPGTHYHHNGLSVVTFAPNAEQARHKHRGPEVGYVLEGEIFIRLEGLPERVVKAGQSFQIPVDIFHTTTAGTKGAKVLAAWVMES